MISICIPVYNTHVLPLAQELNRQLALLNRGGEIIIFDDFSSFSFKAANASVSFLPFVRYKELDANVGRLAIRKLMAENAKYEWLLFLDGDSSIDNEHYLSNYVNVVGDGMIYSGGRNYRNAPPDCSRKLHWKYGIKRESVRGKTETLHSNNFCVSKTVFLQFNFPEQLNGYGYEDTWMQIEIERLGKKIKYIDNPVIHEGVEEVHSYLAKTNTALKNLLFLEKLVGTKLLSRYVKLYRAYRMLKKYQMLKIFAFFYSIVSKNIEKNLYSCKPSLALFDMYRLFHLYLAKEKTLPK